MREIIINDNDASQRLDKFLTKYLTIPRGMLYKGLRKNCVRVNGRHVKDGAHILKSGDVLTLYFADEFFDTPRAFEAGRSDIDVVYEDENIILINKPAGLVVHSDDRGTADTLLKRMTDYLYKKGEYRPEAEHSFAPAFCNRLDRNTSGIIIGAKNAAALRIINEKIRNREIKKIYLCVADGHTDDKASLTAYLERGEKKVFVSDFPNENSKMIKTDYTTVARGADRSLVEVKIGTGRTHQIRAHMAHIGHPLSGDKKYGSKTAQKIQLASYKLHFDFTSDAGILNYLNGRIFQITVDFADTFPAINS